MDLMKLSDKEYHKILRHYRAYLDVCVEENKAKEERVIPVSFEKYAENKRRTIT